MHAHRLELLAPGVGKRGFARIGQHDRRAVGGVQREQLDAGRDLRRLREQLFDVLRTDRLDVSQAAVAEMRQRILGDRRVGGVLFARLVVQSWPSTPFIERSTRSSPVVPTSVIRTR